jgi:hypothetical protein
MPIPTFDSWQEFKEWAVEQIQKNQAPGVASDSEKLQIGAVEYNHAQLETRVRALEARNAAMDASLAAIKKG